MHRRSFIAGAAAALSYRVSCAFAQPRDRIRAVAHDAIGTTLTLALDCAPFPSAGAPYTDDNVFVYVPAHYRFHSREGVAALVHFHGHHTTADRAMAAHELREQLSDSRQNALLIVPQLAVLAADSACGKLEVAGGFRRMVEEAIAASALAGAAVLGSSAYPRNAPIGTVCLSAHSGGYHAASCALRGGGIDVREAYLFDALYAEADTFRDWVSSRRGEPLHRRHKLVSYFADGGAPARNSRSLRSELESGGVACEEEEQEGVLSRHELSHAEAVFVRTGVWHDQVTWETNALRDCLYASALPRHLSSDWFARKHGARPIEKRLR